MAEVAIQISRLKKYFGKTKAVDDISLEIRKGEVYGFLGPNGAGKTTTIRCLMDFLRPDAGKISVLGLDAKTDSVAIKERIGFLPSEMYLHGDWTGQEHTEFIQAVRGKKFNFKTLAEKFDLNLHVKAKHLSTGNKQKLGIVLTLMTEPELLVLDEPTRGLDPLLQNTFYKCLGEFKQKGATVFMSSHILPEIERVCDRVAIIREGKIVGIEVVEEFKQSALHLVTIRFENPADRSTFSLPSAEKADELPDGLILKVKGDLDPLIKELAKYKIKDLELDHSSLEDLFLSFYKEKKS
ncbi:MAG TPA: ABC transporter ATP-binding protein [Candidatus Saccharimonadales bacterium]|nr:ABC transporter ATP-binding protein [Candidatus Saccharimonadales bacterium]